MGENDENILNQYKGIKGSGKKSTPKNGDNLFLLDSIKSKETVELSKVYREHQYNC